MLAVQEMFLTDAEKDRYNRQINLKGFGTEAQLKLKNAAVLVVGAGGLGCSALLYLTAVGAGNIGIMDGDSVALSNLQRQILFKETDLGKNKAEAAKNNLMLQNSAIKIDAFPHFIDALNGLEICKNYDVIIDATDNFNTRYLLNDIAVILNKPLVYASLYQFEGQISVFNYKNGPTLRCLYPDKPSDGLIDNCAEAGILGVLAGMMGAWQAQEAIKIITQIGEVLSGKLLIYNSLNNEVNTFSFDGIESNKALKDLNQYLNKNEIIRNEVDAETLKQWLNITEIELIDVRESYEFEDENIGGINIPLNTLEQEIMIINQKKKVVFICQTGKRSALAYDIFNKHFPLIQAFHLKGGLNDYLL